MTVTPFVFSIHGPDNSIHDSITGIPGSFDETMHDLRNALELGVEIRAKIVLSPLNLAHMVEMTEMLLECGVSHLHLAFPMAPGGAVENKSALIPRYGDCLSRMDDVFERAISSGSRELISLKNFPPCFFRGQEAILDEFISSEIVSIGEVVEEKINAPGCARCLYFFTCRGFDRSYAERFGTNEFIPVETQNLNIPFKKFNVTLFKNRYPCLEPVRFLIRPYGGNIVLRDLVIPLTERGRRFLMQMDGTTALGDLLPEPGFEEMEFLVSLFRRRALWLLSSPSPPLRHVRELMEIIEKQSPFASPETKSEERFEFPLFQPWPEKYNITLG
ncbi:MAG: hypothetical protein V2A78_01050 [bacterium]